MKKSLFKTFILALCLTTFCALILPTTPAKASLTEVEHTSISNYSLLDFYTELDQEEVVENYVVEEEMKEITQVNKFTNLFFGNFIHFIDLKLLPLIVNFNHFFIL